MPIDYQKELSLFRRACNGRFASAFAKGMNPDHPHTFEDANLNKRWRGWCMHAEWVAGGERRSKRSAEGRISDADLLAMLDEVNDMPNRDHEGFYLKFAKKIQDKLLSPKE